MVDSLETKFQKYHQEGKLEDFNSFQQLYQWVCENALNLVEAQRILFDQAGEEIPADNVERFDKLADELEKAGALTFLERYSASRVGEVVDEKEIKKSIERTVELVIQE